MRYDVGRFRRPMRRSTEGQLASLVSLGDGSTLTLDFTTGLLDPRLTFSQSTGGSYVGPDGLLYGFDTSSSSNTIGTGSKTFTLSATAGVNRRYAVGDLVIASSGANNMSGSVTSYDPTTQSLVCSMASSSGSGTFTTWIIGNRQPRFDHDPTTLAPKGLLIEGQTVNIVNWSESFATSGSGALWNYNTYVTRNATQITGPDGNTSAYQFNETADNQIHRISQSIPASAGAYSISIWAKVLDTNTPRRLFVNAVTFMGAGALFDLDPAVQTGASGSAVATSGTAANRAGTWVKYPNNWYRVTLIGTYSTNATVYFQINRASSTTATDDTFVGSTSNGLALWGCQIEQGSGASSYIPTGASTATRNRDQVALTNLSSINFSQTEGTCLATVEVREKADSTFLPYGSFDTSGGGRCWWWLRHNLSTVSGTRLLGTAFNSGGSTGINTSNYVYNGGSGGVVKFATSLNTAASSMVFSISGGAPQTTTAAAFTLATAAQWGLNTSTDVGATALGSMWMQSFKYWPTALPDAQLQSLTT